MILSSPERHPVRGAAGRQAPASRCVWDQLDAALREPEPAAQQSRDALHALEVDAAYRKGRAEGELAAHARARREVETAGSAARGIVREVREAQAAWNRVMEENLAALAAAVATRLLERELTTDAATLRGWIERALALYPATQPLRIHVSPADLAALAGREGCDAPGERDIRWVADETLLPGGCLVEGPERIVDGRLEEGLKRIYQVLAHG
ncbi:MAG TPA: FliH/SctL family protein [Longimicrobiales bacterium]|nr:FliH/SctL family protein [Longimicrobiales bacterium]